MLALRGNPRWQQGQVETITLERRDGGVEPFGEKTT